MQKGLLGQICTPASGNRVLEGVDWCADNGVFGNTYPGDDAYLAWLERRAWAADRCAFAVAPDVVGDAAGTLARSGPMLDRIRRIGFPVAFAGQNGIEDLTVPWDAFDVLFLGGDDPWKLGRAGRALTARARALGKPVHMGRVNSRKRLRYAVRIGCTSADGTYLGHGPDENLPRLLGWLSEIHDAPAPWYEEVAA